ncbi:MAG: hypothetical protein ABSA57_03385 [Candidatus Acidiferrales bacterium]
MNSPIQFALRLPHRNLSWLTRAVSSRAGILLALLLFCPVPIPAQDAQPNIVGRIEGTDISVQGPSTPGNDNETSTPSILVGNGSVVTVHTGDARMTLLSGGEVDICGPAKFTLLQSGVAITLALDFGRIRVQLPASVTLRLFSPTIVATPIDISGGPRDITVGLGLDDSLCVLAASGALQLEHQFSGEKLIVPEAGEFFLNAGKLLPVAGKPGGCQCAAMKTPPRGPPAAEPQEYAANVQPLTALPPPPTVAANAPPASPPAPVPNVEFSIPAHANQSHPVEPAERTAAPPTPPATAPASAPIYTVVAPLSFSAGTPLPPPEQPVDTLLLVREAQVQPTWEFRGHVDAPNFAVAMQHALGETNTPSQPPAEPQRKHRGFWGTLRRIFEGNGNPD